MGNNSIRINLSKEDIISDIRLMKGANTSSNQIFLIVEGKDDIIFFQKRINSDVFLYESFSGCVGVREIIELFSINNVIGICDRDYDNLYTNDHIFFYDYNCLEMMLISHDEVLNSLCSSCYTGKLNHVDLRLQILNDLKLVSILRKINFDEKIGINFERMSIKSLYDKSKEKIDITKIKDSIQSNIIMDKRDQIARLKSQFTTYDELLQITNGHDFISYLQLVFETNKPPKSKSMGVDHVYMSLTIAFRKGDFENTLLYQNLSVYERQYGLSILA